MGVHSAHINWISNNSPLTWCPLRDNIKLAFDWVWSWISGFSFICWRGCVEGLYRLSWGDISCLWFGLFGYFWQRTLVFVCMFIKWPLFHPVWTWHFTFNINKLQIKQSSFNPVPTRVAKYKSRKSRSFQTRLLLLEWQPPCSSTKLNGSRKW